MSLRVSPGPVSGRLRAPPSKSYTHRALLCGLLAGGARVEAPLESADTVATRNAVVALGGQVSGDWEELIVEADAIAPAEVDCRNSGTTLRFATAVAALAEGRSTLTGDGSLRQRPMGPLLAALEDLGATTEAADGRPPVAVTGPIVGGETAIRGDVSSQFVSALIVVGAAMEEGLQLALETELSSRPYVEMTIQVLDAFGVSVEDTPDGFRVDPQPFRSAVVRVPGDYSAAAFPLVAGAVAGGPVRVEGLPDQAVQGDAAILGHLAEFGCRIDRQDGAVSVEGGSLHGTDVDLRDTPDLFPPLAVLAAASEGTSVLHGAPHLRAKESDRIAAMVDGLLALGIDADERPDGAEIEGGDLTGGTVDSRGDHRIQMAFVVAGLAASDPVVVDGPTDAYSVSYPGFLRTFERMGAGIDAGTN